MVRDQPDAVPRRRSAGRSSGRATRRKGELAKRAPVEPAGEPRVLLRRDRRGRQLRRHLPVGGARLRQRPDQGSARRRAGSPSLAALQAIEKSGIFKDQKVAIAPIRTGGGASLEADPLLSKDIRFLFEPNSATLDMANQENLKNLEAIKKLLQVSPGSTLLLRGHVDNAMVDEFRKQGGEALVRTHGAARHGAQQEPRRRDPQAAGRAATASTPSASRSSAAAGKSRPDRTRI